MNLVGNACKFTQNGRITLRAHHWRHAGVDWLAFEVEDTGIGMSEPQMARLFSEFTQADVSTTRRFGGTGLGLAISQRLCHLMGGAIHVRSRERVGSTFIVEVPATAPGVHQAQPAAACTAGEAMCA
jgi:signal transduction histidine kinase